MNKILYLHGFNSSPDSHKARMLLAGMKKMGLGDRVAVPAIPPVPSTAIELLQEQAQQILAGHGLALVGSSLGGFYATWLAERYQCPAVLINPAVKPHELLGKYLGENINYYTDERWMLDASHIEEFRRLYVETLSRPERYLLMVQTGDQTLDYREALERYRGCEAIVEQGGSHEFTGFESHIDTILSFCEVV